MNSSSRSLILPPLNKFHKFLCSLNYYEDLGEDKLNLQTDQDQPEELTHNHKRDIGQTFDTVDEYILQWEYLFEIESKQSIKKDERLDTRKSEVLVLRSLITDKDAFIFQFVKQKASDISYKTNDFILVSLGNPNEPHPEHLMGIVDSVNEPQINIRTYIDLNENSVRVNNLKEAVKEDSQWNAVNLCNLATQNREYQALQSIADLYLRDVLLQPNKNIPSKVNHFDIPEALNNKLKTNYNSSQYQAIKECLKRDGVTLIQGPPGTGKTTTILGVLSVLLSSKPKFDKKKARDLKTGRSLAEIEAESSTFNKEENMNSYRKAMPWIYQNNFDDWQEDRDHWNTEQNFKQRKHVLPEIHEQTVTKPAKILICAPSNAAIDEIIRKMIEKGLLDENGNKYDPTVIRIGPGYHTSLKNFTLDHLIEEEQRIRKDDVNVIRNDILKKAQIVCSTLSYTGSSLLTSNAGKFDTVVVDEAAQAVEISTLIPLKFDCKRLILIGDPKQLPATVFSRTAQSHKYDQSLFFRLQSTGYPVHMLNVQYRMNPQISKFISDSFYKSKLQDYDQIMEAIGKPDFYANGKLEPVTFFNVKGQEEFHNSTYRNISEAQFIVKVYKYLQKHISDFDKNKIGIITPYNGQKEVLENLIREADGTIYCQVDVNSVDGFQGREKDIIIFSTVRSQYEGIQKDKNPTIGFLRDKRRMNVGLSRARVGLIVVGDLFRLVKAKRQGEWKNLAKYCISCKRAFNTPSSENLTEKYFIDFRSNPNQFLVEDKALPEFKSKKKNSKKKDGEIVDEAEEKQGENVHNDDDGGKIQDENE